MIRFWKLYLALLFLILFGPREFVPNGPTDYLFNSVLMAWSLAVVMTWIKERKS